MSVLRILIADDHEVAGKAFAPCSKFRPEWEVCAEAKDGRGRRRVRCRLKPDICCWISGCQIQRAGCHAADPGDGPRVRAF